MSQLSQRILVAEDNSVLSHVLRFNLESAGYAVTAAADGREAIGKLQAGAFDLLITDYQMPHVDGAGLCRYIREEAQLLDLPIILCSAKGLELNAMQFEEQWHITRVFFKPFSMRDMLRCVEEVLETASCAAAPVTGA